MTPTTPTCGPPPRCFQGVMPAMIATASADGSPNITYLSQVFHVDERHVALSCQFFNKTKANVLANPYATVILSDPVTFEAYRLALRYLRSEEEGPLFETMSLRIQAIASHTGMLGVFRLLSADIYEVERCEAIEGFLDRPPAGTLDDLRGHRNELRSLQLLSQRVSRATDLQMLLDDALEALDTAMGFAHAMFLLPDPAAAEAGPSRLSIVASRGYGGISAGGIALGEGLVGTVAQQRRILRMSGVDTEMRYGRAIRDRAARADGCGVLSPEVPLPGLPDAHSHLALPLVAADRLVGVLAVESRDRLAFDEWDETFLEIIANQIAAGIESVRSRDVDPVADPLGLGLGRRRTFRFFAADDCVFVDDAYLVRNVPGRILWKLLREHVDRGRTEFSNRELRLDPWLGLPPVRDNLESRLSLLRKRLESKCPDLQLQPTSRGHFRLVSRCGIELAEVDGGA